VGTIVTVIASVRAATHRPGLGPLPDATLEAWANEDYPTIRRRLADEVPDVFTKVTADIPIAEGTASFILTAAPASLTDFGKLRVVEVKQGTVYRALRWASALAPFTTAGLAGTYRVQYISKAATLAISGPTTLDWPEGMDRVLIEQLAARVRIKFNESPKVHLDEMERVFRETRNSLLRQYVSTPQVIVDAGVMAAWPAYRFRGPATVELVGGW
jgi:hypothetical protein